MSSSPGRNIRREGLLASACVTNLSSAVRLPDRFGLNSSRTLQSQILRSGEIPHFAQSRRTIRDAQNANDGGVWCAPEDYGRTASLISPLRDFMPPNAFSRSAKLIPSLTKSQALIYPRL